MSFLWEKAFSQGEFPWKDVDYFSCKIDINNFETFKHYLDFIQIKFCLLKEWSTQPQYPIIEHRELLPSFEAELLEYKELPGFSMVAFARPLESFNEIFQYDILHSCDTSSSTSKKENKELELKCINHNIQTFLTRLPKNNQDTFKQRFQHVDISSLDYYPAILPYLCHMDRAHVFATDLSGFYYLAGIFGSFPSDIDGEIKRFGLKIRKFQLGDNNLYEKNRLFVYQFLMELYGFPVASERRTSAALFSRRLHKMGEHFMVRVLGQSDRVITTIWNNGGNRLYPRVEKVALIRIEPGQKEVIDRLSKGGYFVDPENYIAIIRIKYKQHRYNHDNVRQERALSVESQEIIHPLTGDILEDINVIKDTSTIILHLNDIVRGEYVGRIVYKRSELIENTDTEEKRLKFLFAWLSKNQRRLVSYSDEFFTSMVKILEGYLLLPHNKDLLEQYNDLYQEVLNRYAYIRQARMVKHLEDIMARNYKGVRISYNKMLMEAVAILRELKFELVTYFDQITTTIIHHIETILDDRYLQRKYIERPQKELTPAGCEIRKNYGRLVSLHDTFISIQASRQ